MLYLLPIIVFVAVAVWLGTIARRRMFRTAARRLVAGLKPRVGFSTTTSPPAPDYRDPAAWAVLPDAPGKSLLTPPGVGAMAPEEAAVDAFFIHPTTFFGATAWNAALTDPRAREGVDEMVVPGQATVFNGCCRVFAPRYRQATLYAFMAPSEDSRRALELAYDDVRLAFTHYLERHNGGRPFIVAGHSQGTLHGIRLLEELVAPTSLRERLVAAYLIGYWVPEDKLETSLAPLRPSPGPTATGCIVAWDTFGEGGGPDRERDRAEHWYPVAGGGGEWRRRNRTRPLCVNPLTGRCGGGAAPAALNLGAVHPLIDGMSHSMRRFLAPDPLGVRCRGLSAPRPGEVSARCGDDGILFISRPRTRAFRRFLMPGASYHNHDYGLFYMNLRTDVARRVEAFLAGRHAS